MKLFRPYIFTLLLSFVFGGALFAQTSHTEEADMAFRTGSYFEAVDLYKNAYSKEKKFEQKKRILYQIGRSYFELQDNKSAEDWLSKAKKAQHNNPEVHFYLAEALKKQGRFDEAIAAYQDFMEAKPGDPRGAQGVESAKKAQEWKDNPTRYVVEPEMLLNSKQGDFSPVWASKRMNELIFTSTREGSVGGDKDNITGASFSSLWYTKQDRKGKWMVPTVLEGEEVNTGDANEGSATMDKRMRTLYFTRCPFEKKSNKGCKIWTTQKRGRSFALPEEVEIDAPDTVAVGHPSMGLNDEYLFFVSDMSGGKGKRDIYFVKYKKRERSWSEPQNVSGINTAGNEMFPYIHDDGRLFFASDGHPGMGGLDIFVAERMGDDSDEWGNVKNLKAPLNSPSNDFGIIFEGDKERGYFTSDRPGGRGGDDIWSFRIPPLRFVIDGMVSDLKTGDPIPGAKVQLTGTDGSTVEVTTDELGYYEFDEKEDVEDEEEARYIKPNTSYTLEVTAENYLKSSGQETTVGVNQSTRFQQDFKLQPIEGEIEFPEVRYDYDDYRLQVNDSVNSKDSLDYLYQTLIENPNLVIELMAHTDTRGSASYNLTLSQKRAQSCVDYLIEKGIAPERLQAKGYGLSSPIISDSEIKAMETEDEKEAAHQKNRRTTFRVLRDDYVPPQTQDEEEQ